MQSRGRQGLTQSEKVAGGGPCFPEGSTSREVGSEHGPSAPAVSALRRNCCGCQSLAGRVSPLKESHSLRSRLLRDIFRDNLTSLWLKGHSTTIMLEKVKEVCVEKNCIWEENESPSVQVNRDVATWPEDVMMMPFQNKSFQRAFRTRDPSG